MFETRCVEPRFYRFISRLELAVRKLMFVASEDGDSPDGARPSSGKLASIAPFPIARGYTAFIPLSSPSGPPPPFSRLLTALRS
jgi:hypothetical protein